MNRSVDEDQLRIKVLETFDRSSASMSGAIVDDPKHATRVIVGRPCHDLFDQTIKRRDAVAPLTTPKDTSVVNVKCGKVGPGTAAIVFVFDVYPGTGPASLRRVLAAACLDAGLLIRGYNEFIVLQWLIFPATGIQIQQPASAKSCCR